MKCARHNKSMIKDSITGLFECRGCKKLDKIVDHLHNSNQWGINLKAVEDYVNHTGSPDIESVVFKKETSNEE